MRMNGFVFTTIWRVFVHFFGRNWGHKKDISKLTDLQWPQRFLSNLQYCIGFSEKNGQGLRLRKCSNMIRTVIVENASVCSGHEAVAGGVPAAAHSAAASASLQMGIDLPWLSPAASSTRRFTATQQYSGGNVSGERSLALALRLASWVSLITIKISNHKTLLPHDSTVVVM